MGEYTYTSSDLRPVNGTPGEIRSIGFGDVTVNGGHSIPLGIWTFHVGGGFSISPGEEKRGTIKQDGNQYSGGMTLEPYLGATVEAGPGLIGLNLEYTHKFKRKSHDPDTRENSETTGGDSYAVTAHYELQLNRIFVVPHVSYHSSAKSTVTTDGDSEESSGIDGYGASLVGGFYATQNLMLAAGYGWLHTGEIVGSTSTGQTIKPIDAYAINAQARIEF